MVLHNCSGLLHVTLKVSIFWKAHTVIEIKRSTNDNLIHGYRTQQAAYMKAERANSGIFVVIMERDNYDEIRQKMEAVQNDMMQNGEYTPDVIYINGMKQPSASKASFIPTTY